MFYSFGASTREYDKAAAKVAATEEKLAALQEKHQAEAERAADALNAKRYEYTMTEKTLAEARARNDVKAIEKTRAALRKLDVDMVKLADTAETAALQRERAENRVKAALVAQEKQLKEMNTIAAKAKKVFSGIGGAIAGGLSIGGIMAALDKTADKLDSLAKRGRDIGLTASQLQEFEHQAKLAGVSAEKLDVSVKAFNRNISLAAMGTGEAKQALEGMGISLTKANGANKTQAELLKETADYFAKNAGEAENAGRAARIFGESGAELLRVFEQGGDAVEKIFNAKGIDEAAAAAERYKDAMENVNNAAFKASSSTVEGMSIIFDRIYELFSDKEFGQLRDERMIKAADEASKKFLAEQAAYRKKIEAEAFAEEEARRDKIQKLDDKLAKARAEIDSKRMSTQKRVNALARELEAEQDKLLHLDQESAEYADQYESVINTTIALEKESLKLAEEKAKELDKQQAAEKKRLRALKAAEDKLKSAEKNKSDYEDRMKESRAEFELQTKIDILKKQGRDEEAKQLESLQKRNELIEKYGYSLDQATKIQKTLNALENSDGNKFSDEAKEKAKKIIERGEGGTVGKKTLAEAQAILEGKTPEGGFTTSMFDKYNTDTKKTPIDSIKVNTQAEKSSLNSKGEAAQKKNEANAKNMDANIADIKQLIADIKNSVNGIFTKKENKTETEAA